MTVIQQILALMAIPATLVLIFQTIMLLFGLGQGDGSEMPDTGASDFPDSNGLDSDEGWDILEGSEESESWTSEGEIDYDPGLRLLTVRGLVAFFAVGGWVGIAAIDLGASALLASVLAVLSGLASLWLVAVIFRMLMKLQSSGNVELKNAIGNTGEVYLRIPANMSGSGKVTVYVQERLIEANAMTNSKSDLPTGTQIEVVGIRGNRLVVESTIAKEN